MVKHAVRGICLVLLATLLVLGAGTSADAEKTPAVIAKAMDTLKCTDMSTYDANGPGLTGYQCYIKGKKLGYADAGRTNMMKFKSSAAARNFWKGWLSDCGGQCSVMFKGKLVVLGANYEKDVAKYAANKLGGTVRTY